MIAKFRSTAILDFVLIAIAVATISVSLWPTGAQRQRVTIRGAAGQNQTVELAVNDPHLRTIRNKMILWGRPVPTSELGFARWKRETSRHYAALARDDSKLAGDNSEAASQATTANGAEDAVVGGSDNTVQPDGNVVQAEFANRVGGGDGAPFRQASAVQPVSSTDLSSLMTEMLAGDDTSLTAATDRESAPQESAAEDLYWIAEAKQADMLASKAHTRMLSLAAAAGPVPFSIGSLVDGPVSTIGKLLSILLGLAIACLFAEWAHQVPPIRLSDSDDDRRSTYGVKTESARVELPAHWVRVIQPRQVRARRALIVVLIASALCCSVI